MCIRDRIYEEAYLGEDSLQSSSVTAARQIYLLFPYSSSIKDVYKRQGVGSQQALKRSTVGRVMSRRNVFAFIWVVIM